MEQKRGEKCGLAIITAVGIAALWLFPPFRVVSLNAPASASSPAAPAVFDPAAAAAKIWQADLPPAASRALELKTLAPALRADAAAARTKFARSAGLGAAYYFVRGSGRVVAVERNTLRLALDDGGPGLVALRIGPVFGNTVRDGCGLLDVNNFPGLQEFNALSAELNALVEQRVLPGLKAKAAVGTVVRFAGCAEAPEGAAEADEPLLIIVPVQAEVP